MVKGAGWLTQLAVHKFGLEGCCEFYSLARSYSTLSSLDPFLSYLLTTLFHTPLLP